MANPRSRARIEARIRERAAYCIEFELNDPRASFVTVNSVEVSSDLSSAKIFYTVLGTDGDRSKVAHMLEDATGFIRRQVGRVLRTRRIPRLTWIYDTSLEIQESMERAISEAIKRDTAINPSAHRDLASPAEEAEPDASEGDGDEVERDYEAYLDSQEREGDA